MTAKKPATDWEAIEREYRAGQLSVSEIGRQFSVSHTAINKRAKKDGWTRNLAAKVREEVSARLVSDQVSGANARAIVEQAAIRGVEIVRSHRQDISTARNIAGVLFSQLGEFAETRAELEEAIDAETAKDENADRRNRMMKAVSLPAHAVVLKDLSTTLKTLVSLERQAFNLDDDAGDDTVNGLADRLSAGLRRAQERGDE